MRLQIAISIFLVFSFLNIHSVHSADFTCSNTANWKTLADHNYDFYTSRIKPDGSPASSLTSDQQLNTFYSTGDYSIIAIPDSQCYAQKTCPAGIVNNPSDWNQSGCSCTHAPQAGCARTTWQVENHPTLVSGGVGTPMPPFPEPTYPTSWNERAVYTHTFAADTTDATISLNITGNLNTDFLPSGSTATASKCSEGATTIGGAEVIVKYFLVNGLSTFDQSFDNWYTPFEIREDWGLCGEVHQYWTEGPHKTVSRPAVSNAIPVIAYVSPSSNQYDYTDRTLGCTSPFSYRGDYINRGQACLHSYSSSGACPDGYSRFPGGFGYSGGCRKYVRAEYSTCPDGSEIDPVNANQCRTEKTFVPPPTDTPDPEEQYEENREVAQGPGPGSGSSGSSGSGSSGSGSAGSGQGESGSGSSGSGSSGSGGFGSSSAPSWCTADSLVWDSSTSTCRSTDGGGVVTPGDPPGDSSNPTLVSFGDAPIAGDSTGTRDIFSSGFYTPVNDPDTTLASFVETAMAGWDTETLKTRLMTFVPPSGTAALPRKCFTLSVSSQEFCIDLNPYAFAFDALRALLYLISGWTAFRIVMGA